MNRVRIVRLVIADFGFVSLDRPRSSMIQDDIFLLRKYARGEIAADNPSGDDENAPASRRRAGEVCAVGGCNGVFRVPRGPRRLRLASGLWPRGIETQLNFKMICALLSAPLPLRPSLASATFRSASSKSRVPSTNERRTREEGTRNWHNRCCRDSANNRILNSARVKAANR